MSDSIALYDEYSAVEIRANLHTVCKSLSDIYMRSQTVLNTEKNLSFDGIENLMKIQAQSAIGLRYIAQPIFMLRGGEFSKPKLEPKFIGEILKEIADTMNDIIFPDTYITFDLETSDEDFTAAIDVMRLEQIIFSIIENSLQYGCGRIVLKLKRKDDKLHIIIKEKSHAIEDDAFDLLFKKYETVNELLLNPAVHKGLSLALARENAREMDGELNAENQKTGLKFTVILPICSVPLRETTEVYVLPPERVLLYFADFILRQTQAKLSDKSLD